MLKIPKPSISVVANCGLGNILCYIASGLYYSYKSKCKMELLFVDATRENSKLLQFNQEWFYTRCYLPFGGHVLPHYPIEEFFPNIKFKFNVFFDSFASNKTIHYNFDNFDKNQENIYNCQIWNFNFLQYLSKIKQDLKINPVIVEKINRKYKSINYSYPCIHLRLRGAKGDQYPTIETPIDLLNKHICSFTTPYYVFSNNIAAANDMLDSHKQPIFIDEPCSLTTFYLLSNFKNLLFLSQSTFSMWAGYFSSAKVIYLPNNNSYFVPLNNWVSL